MNVLASIVLVVAIATACLLSGCASDPDREQSGGQQGAQAPEATLSRHVLPIFARACGVCHRREGGSEAAVANKVYYETGADIMARVGKFIIPGKPAESGLMKILDQTAAVGKSMIVMPPPGSPVQKLPREDLDAISRWIASGAKDN